MTKKKINKVLGMPEQLREELDGVRKKFKEKLVWSDNATNNYIRECNAIINEIQSYKKEVLKDKKKKQYALNFDFPIRKKEND